MDYKKINDKILEVYKECKIKDFPINCIEVLNHYGFKLYTYKKIQDINPDVYKIAKSFSDDAFKYDNIICYNSSKDKNRIRFTLMHELGHFILGHMENSETNEDEANYFASCMLAPRIAILKTGCNNADEIHDTFGLSYAASNRAITDFNSWKQKKNLDSEKLLHDFLFPQKAVIEKISVVPLAESNEWIKMKNRMEFIANYICNLEEYAFRQRENQIYNGG